MKISLNPQQKKAAETLNGPVLILAGAGAGKTMTLTARIIKLVLSGILPQNILAITFTNKAAGEMKERILKAIKNNPKINFPTLDYGFTPFISTFHSLGVYIIRENHQKLNISKYFSIYDRADMKKAVKEALTILNLDPKEWEVKSVISFISKNKGDFLDLKKFSRIALGNFYTETMLKIWTEYENIKKKDKALDFDDLLLESAKLLENNSEIREHYLKKWTHIHIDEYQDTNKVQYKIAKLLTNAKTKNIFVVGDDDQCFVKNTKISINDGYKNIQDLKVGDFVVTASGRGGTCQQKISSIKKKKVVKNILEIKTKSGNILQATENHIFFSQLPSKKNIYYVYFMHRKSIGFRIGTTIGIRKVGKENKKENGLRVRANQENADKVWILKIVKSEEEARYFENYYSLLYGIPTTVFHTSGRNVMISQEDINKLHRDLNTKERAEKVFKDFGLNFDFPHYLSQGTTAKNSLLNRTNINLTMFADTRKSLKNPWSSTRVSLNSSDKVLKERFEKNGFLTKKSKDKDKWRYDTSSLDYEKMEKLIYDLQKIDSNLILLRNGFFIKDSKHLFLPASSLRIYMKVPVLKNRKIINDEIVSIKKKEYKGYVYDLNIKNTHNYIAENLVVHNSIYGWRGSDIENILNFEKEFDDVVKVFMEQNYRSTKNIIEASNFVIEKNEKRYPKKLFTEKSSGQKIILHNAFSEKEEARYTAQKVKEILSEWKKNKEQKNENDIAILYRANFQSRVLEEAFLRENISYQVLGTKFFDRAEVKDIISYVRTSKNPESLVDIKRIINSPKRGIGKSSVVKIFAGIETEEVVLPAKAQKGYNDFKNILKKITEFIDSKNNPKMSQVVEFVIKESGYEKYLMEKKTEDDLERLANIYELVNFSKKYDYYEDIFEALEIFLEEVALMSDADSNSREKNEKKPAVKFMTIHSSKGLEFDTVFLDGTEDHFFSPTPNLDKKKMDEKLEEERRLFYVAMTRAKEKLFFTWASMRTIYGKTETNLVCDFVLDIQPDLLEEESTFGGNSKFDSSEDDVVYLDW